MSLILALLLYAVYLIFQIIDSLSIKS